MANTKSAAKRARQSETRAARNKSINSAVRTQVRKVREALTRKDEAAVETELKAAASALAKAASKGVLHKRNASRRIARLAQAAAALKATAQA